MSGPGQDGGAGGAGGASGPSGVRRLPGVSPSRSEHGEGRGDGAVHWGGKSADQPGQDPAERSPHVPGRLLAAPGALEATGPLGSSLDRLSPLPLLAEGFGSLPKAPSGPHQAFGRGGGRGGEICIFSWVCSVLADSLRPRVLQPARLLRPWHSPLEWLAISSRGSSPPRARTWISCISYIGRRVVLCGFSLDLELPPQ